MSTHKPNEYRHIRAWGMLLHSSNSYIREQQAVASFENAPLDAIFRRGGHWVTEASISTAATRHVFSRILAEMPAPVS